MPGQGEDRAFSILLELPGAFLHKLEYRQGNNWQGCAEYQVKGEKVPGHTVAALPPKPSCSRNNESPVQVSLEHAKEM